LSRPLTWLSCLFLHSYAIQQAWNVLAVTHNGVINACTRG
jgi:broad specificity phosphatase PhoE